uniref:Microsomal glutathione S-transferase 1 n=1 Tax=Arcella intermedia TaxID=1963864 RepID=A0A6B2LPW7_9EUKA
MATLALLGKYFITVGIQGSKRFQAGSRPPEDTSMAVKSRANRQTFGREPPPSEGAGEADVRWQRIVQNDLENLPLGLIVAWGSLFSCYSPRAHSFLVGLFCASRIGHTYCYAHAMQPHRSVMYVLGMMSTVGMGLNGLLGLYKKK